MGSSRPKSHKQHDWMLQEKIKGLTCLCNIERLIARLGTNLDAILKHVVSSLQSAWQYPDTVCARIVYNGQRFATANFKQTRWKQSADIKARGKKVGIVEVYYVKKEARNLEDAFPRARELLDVIALRLGRLIERIQVENSLKEYSSELRSFVESAPVIVALFDSNLNCVDANEDAVKSTGLRRRKLLGRNLLEIWPDVKQSGRYERCMEVLRTGKPFFTEILHAHPRRGNKYLSVRAFKAGDTLGLIAVDVTEHELAEKKLHEVSLYTRGLIEASLDPLVTISPEGKITDVNHATELVTEISRDRLIGSDFSQYFTDPEKAREGYREVFLKGSVIDYPLTIRGKSGKLTDVVYNASLYRGENGNVMGIFAAARDITERKKSEEKAHAASLYARSLIEASLDPLVTISAQGKITDVNKATEHVTGVSRERLIGSDFSDYFTEPEKARRGYEEAFSKGFVRDYPLTIRAESGRVTDVLYNATVYKNEVGEVQGIFAAARDITERKRSEAELEKYREHLEELVRERTETLLESEARLRLAQETAGAGLWDWDISSGKLEWSGALFRLFGLDSRKSEASFDSWRRLLHPDDRQAAEKQIEMAIENHTSLASEYRIVLPSGEVRWINALGNTIYDDSGKPLRMSGICLDISDRKRLEGLRDQFISAVTHELRTPLVTIKGYSDYLLGGSMGTLPQRAEKSLKVIKESSDRLLNITNDLLDYRRLTMGRFELDSRQVDLRRIVEISTRHIQPFLEEKQQTLRVRVPAHPLLIQGDETRLMQVFMNMLDNASKFSPENGAIHLHVEEEPGFFRVSIADNGIGMKRQDLNRVFEPFASIEKPSYIKGTGLGLSVVKGLIEAHGGRIWADSEGEGKGSTFTFTIPIFREKRR